MKRFLSLALMVLSCAVVLGLIWQLMRTPNKLMLSMYLVAPLVFCLPWWVIAGGR